MSISLKEHIERTPTQKHWEKIGLNHHHGFNIALSSIHSDDSEGIGDFYDLMPLFHFAKEVGFDIIQLLPIYDTGVDPSPYNAFSGFALNPVYLRLAKLPGIDSFSSLQISIQKLRSLTKSPEVPYKEIRKRKLGIFTQYVKLASPQELPSYQSFKKKHPWLIHLALYYILKEKHQKRNWESWPEEDRDLPLHLNEEVLKRYEHEIDFYSLLQFFCALQLSEAKQYADSLGVKIMGDIPILIARNSCDAWAYRHLFQLDRSCGAPPDMYNPAGQNWGFPIYDWDVFEKEDYKWWRERLKLASSFFHLYRIDHVIGFFRFWSLSHDNPDEAGTFYPAEKKQWIPNGVRNLKLFLETTDMLPIGEDLGTATEGVRETLYDLGIPGTRVMRWEHKGTDFLPLKEYSPLSMCTISTHDSEPLRTWWHRYPQESQRWAHQFNIPYRRNLSGEALWALLQQCHHTSSLIHINLLQEYLSLMPELTYDDPNSDRINIPGTISPKNWVYRMKPRIEEIRTHDLLKAAMSKLTHGHSLES